MDYSLKPTWQRGILTLILVFILFFLPLIPASNQVQCIRAPCPPLQTMIAPYQLFNQNIIFNQWTLAFLISELIITYLLACFLTMKTRDFYP